MPEGIGWVEGMGQTNKSQSGRSVKNYDWWMNTETGARKRALNKPDGHGWIKGFKL